MAYIPPIRQLYCSTRPRAQQGHKQAGLLTTNKERAKLKSQKERRRKVNWFKRHLNWTILIAAVVGLILPFSTIFAETATPYVIMLIIQAVTVVGVCGWVLKQKGRSLRNLFWLLLGWLIGIIILMSMDNVKLEADRKTVEYTSGKCPYCGVSNPDERIKRGPYYGDVKEAYGYTYMWDCHCHHCGAKWYALER